MVLFLGSLNFFLGIILPRFIIIMMHLLVFAALLACVSAIPVQNPRGKKVLNVDETQIDSLQLLPSQMQI